MRLFRYNDYKVEVDPEALMLRPFKALYDKYKNKEEASIMFAFIYFYADPRSDYQYDTDKETRMENIKIGLGLPDKWKPDETLNKAIEFYESFKPMTALLLEDTYASVGKLRTFLREIDLNEKDDKGKPVYSPNQIASTIKLVPTLVKDLNEAEKTINSELMSNAKARGVQKKSLCEDGIPDL